MFNKNRIFITLLIITLFAPTGTMADDVPPPSNNWSATVNVPDTCTVTDTDTVAHTYTGYLGICALQQAINDGAISSASLSNEYPAFGLFVTGINGVSADPSSQYWALYQNSGFASVGVTQLSVSVGDEIKLELHDFSDNYQGSRLTITVNSLVSTTQSSPTPSTGGGGIERVKPEFDVPAAVSYIRKAMSSDGSLPTEILTDWAAFAFAVHDIDNGYSKLRTYELAAHPAMASLTDYERHAMALMALSIDPYIGTDVDYVTPIVRSFDGTQFGEYNLTNDDIFAVFPLLKAGYSTEDTMLQKAKSFIIERQLPNGSWENSVDLTAAAMQALFPFEKTENVRRALTRAELYLSDNQRDNGGFGSSFSTAWALQAISNLENSHTIWTKRVYHTPRYYFAELQQKDGGVESIDTDRNTRLWATMYAVPGVRGRTWLSLMHEFPKPVPAVATSTQSVQTLSTATYDEPAPDDEIQQDASTTPETIEQTAAAAATGTDAILALIILALLLLILFGLAVYLAFIRKYWR